MQPTGPPAQVGQQSPGWYVDPWATAPWRWWDGQAWTAHVGGSTGRKPRLPSWLSPPILICALPVLIASAVYFAGAPLAVLLGLVPLVIVLPALWWLDRVEPEPRGSLVHSLLWGATVAILISSVVNGIVDGIAGTTVAAVVSAPLIEEATKGLGVYWIVRRKELDSVVDGVIYASWVALGFAVVEDFQYFATADAEDQLLAVFIVRGIVTPFAHPLFTFWIGLAAGLAVERSRSVGRYMLFGYVAAVATHAAWNGSLSLSETESGGVILLVAAAVFVILFGTVLVSLIRVRQKERQQFARLAPMLVQRYGLSAAELDIFSDWRRTLATRRSLTRPQRKHFDRVHASLARLAVLHSRQGRKDSTGEKRLAQALQEARQAEL